MDEFAFELSGNDLLVKQIKGALIGGAVGAIIGSQLGVAGAFGAVAATWPLAILLALFGVMLATRAPGR